MIRSVLLCVLLLPAAGCGLFGSEDLTIVATGRVVEAGTDAPIAGLGVSLDKAGSFGLNPIVVRTRTGADGSFRVTYEPNDGDLSTHMLRINDEPHNTQYSVSRTSLIRGETRDFGVVALRRNDVP